MSAFRRFALVLITIFGSAGFTRAQTLAISPRLVIIEAKKPTAGGVVAEIFKQTGLKLEVPANWIEQPVEFPQSKIPFWQAAEHLAAQLNARLADSAQGRQWKLVPLSPGMPAPPRASSGAFRVVARSFTAKQTFETGLRTYEIQLDLVWEPRFPMFYIDSEPKILSVKGGKPGTQSRVRSAVSGYTHPLTVHLTEIPRTQLQLDQLEIQLSGIGAEKMLPFVFDDLANAKPASQEQEGVKVIRKPPVKDGPRVHFHFDLEYPANHPELESFQQWASGNRLRLLAPDGRTSYEPSDFSTLESGRKVAATYTYEAPPGKALPFGDWKGWKAVYETPSPLKEVELTFSLKDLRLP